MKILQIKTLDKGWHDRDNLMLHAAFQILVDYMEKEKPGEVLSWNWRADHTKAWRTLRALYKWWTVTRPARTDPDTALLSVPLTFKQRLENIGGEKILHTPYIKASLRSGKLQEKWHAEDDRQLHRLIDVRLFMWT